MGPNRKNPGEKAGDLDCSFSSTTDLLCDPWTSLVLNIHDCTSILTILSLPWIRRSFHYHFLAIPDILVKSFILFSIKPLKDLKTNILPLDANKEKYNEWKMKLNCHHSFPCHLPCISNHITTENIYLLVSSILT